jgi:small subunit ribosomal protein S20
MPIIKSAKKRVRTAQRAAVRNNRSKRSLNRALKTFQRSLSGTKVATLAAHRKAQSELDKAYKKKLMSKHKVARKQSKLAQTAKANAGRKTSSVASKKRPASTPASKQPAPKKKTV